MSVNEFPAADVVVEKVREAYMELYVVPCQERSEVPSAQQFLQVRDIIIARVVKEIAGEVDGMPVPRKAVTTAVDLTHQEAMGEWDRITRERQDSYKAAARLDRICDVLTAFYATEDEEEVLALYDEASRLLTRADADLLIVKNSRFMGLATSEGLTEAGEPVIKDLRKIVAGLSSSIGKLRRDAAEEKRRERIVGKRTPDVKMHGTRCECGKPARIDGWCKKCARANGIIIHGKIGES